MDPKTRPQVYIIYRKPTLKIHTDEEKCRKMYHTNINQKKGILISEQISEQTNLSGIKKDIIY